MSTTLSYLNLHFYLTNKFALQLRTKKSASDRVDSTEWFVTVSGVIGSR